MLTEAQRLELLNTIFNAIQTKLSELTNVHNDNDFCNDNYSPPSEEYNELIKIQAILTKFIEQEKSVKKGEEIELLKFDDKQIDKKQIKAIKNIVELKTTDLRLHSFEVFIKDFNASIQEHNAGLKAKKEAAAQVEAERESKVIALRIGGLNVSEESDKQPAKNNPELTRLINELSEYYSQRNQAFQDSTSVRETYYRSVFFSLPFKIGYSADEKLTAVDKLVCQLSRSSISGKTYNQPITFSEREIGALRNGKLAQILEKYTEILKKYNFLYDTKEGKYKLG